MSGSYVLHLGNIRQLDLDHCTGRLTGRLTGSVEFKYNKAGPKHPLHLQVKDAFSGGYQVLLIVQNGWLEEIRAVEEIETKAEL